MPLTILHPATKVAGYLFGLNMDQKDPKDFNCAYTDHTIHGKSIVTNELLTSAGYLPQHIDLVTRYFEMTGCQRHHAARAARDDCTDPRHHLTFRTYKPIPISLTGGAIQDYILYKEVFENLEDIHHEGLVGRRILLPGQPDLSVTANNVDIFADYEPARENSSSAEKHMGGFHFGAMFDLYNQATHQLHPSKIVLRYSPWTGTYNAISLSVYNVDHTGRSTGYCTKLDILPVWKGSSADGVRHRIQFGRKDLAPDSIGKNTSSIVGLGIDSSPSMGRIISVNSVTQENPNINKLERKFDTRGVLPYGNYEISHTSTRNKPGRGQGFFGFKEVTVYDSGSSIGIKQSQGDQQIVWELPKGILSPLSLPTRPSPEITDQDVIGVFSEVLPIFRRLVYEQMTFSSQFCGINSSYNNSAYS